MIKKIIIFISFFYSFHLAASLQAKWTINGSSQWEMQAGAPADWRIQFFDMQDQKHSKFMKMHAKPMHMIVVSSDLGQFSHIHPHLSNGNFDLRVNTEDGDPDNFDNPQVTPCQSSYFVFTEVMPMPVNEMMPMIMNRFPLSVDGQDCDPIEDDRRHIKEKFINNNHYRISFSYDVFEFCGQISTKILLFS